MANEVSKPNMDRPWGWELPTLSKEQAEWLDEWFAKRGFSAAQSAPRICSQECPVLNQCPLYALRATLPIGCQCPVETTLMQKWSTEMRVSLGVEDDDRWSLMLVEYVSMWHILCMRALSEPGADKVVVDSYRGVDKLGNALFEKKVNPALAFAQSIQKIIQSIGKELVATQEAKAKLQQAKTRVGPDEYAKIVEAQFTASDADIKDKSRTIREKRRTLADPDKTDVDKPRIPDVDYAGLDPRS